MAGSRWLEQASSLGRALRTSPRSAGGLLVVGTPDYEPWHVTAHLDDEARLSGITELTPTLVRWAPPAGAPPHLAVGLARLEAARRGETLFVVAEGTAPVPLLERVSDARKTGATILALDSDDPELDALAHEALVRLVPAVPDLRRRPAPRLRRRGRARWRPARPAALPAPGWPACWTRSAAPPPSIIARRAGCRRRAVVNLDCLDAGGVMLWRVQGEAGGSA